MHNWHLLTAMKEYRATNQFPKQFHKMFGSLIFIHKIRYKLQLLKSNLTIPWIPWKVPEIFPIKQALPRPRIFVNQRKSICTLHKTEKISWDPSLSGCSSAVLRNTMLISSQYPCTLWCSVLNMQVCDAAAILPSLIGSYFSFSQHESPMQFWWLRGKGTGEVW